MTVRGWEGLADPPRLRALDLTGLDAVPDESFDRFARLVRRTVGVPVALVSLVDAQRQFFPGADGLGEPWCDARQTPLSHSFCQMVVIARERLVITDARTDPRVAGNPAITDLGVIGYAGMPLVDGAGNVLGSLCAIDTQPRQWSGPELSILADLAAACSAELQLRIAVTLATRTDAQLTTLSHQVSRALNINQLLLQASEAMARADTVEEVALAANHLGSGGSSPAFVGVGLITEDRTSLELVSVPSDFAHLDAVRATVLLVDDGPAGRCINRQAPIYLPDLPAVTADFPSTAVDMAARAWGALACIPLPGPAGPLGALVIAWAQPYPMGIIEQATLTSLAGYTANALQRVTYLRDTVGIAEKLQRAMLTELPVGVGVELVARYRPARATEKVGGDWYDAFVLPDGDTVLVIGDVAGHDMAAATVMGQLRSILRGYAVDRGESPAVLLRRLDHANRILGVHAVATAVVARVGAPDERGVRSVLWANAGHPPPVVLTADGRTHPLAGRDLLLGANPETTRRNYQTQLRPGDTLILYTDGLVEDRRVAGADRTDELHAALTRHQAIPLPKLLDTVIEELSGHHRADDVAVLAYRLD